MVQGWVFLKGGLKVLKVFRSYNIPIYNTDNFTVKIVSYLLSKTYFFFLNNFIEDWWQSDGITKRKKK